MNINLHIVILLRHYELDNAGNPITDDDYIIETGFLAQEVKTIPELNYTVDEIPDKMKQVKQYKTDSSGNCVLNEEGEKIIETVEKVSKLGRYTLKYNDIFVMNVAATQELDRIIQSQQETITLLQNELHAIKNHLNLN